MYIIAVPSSSADGRGAEFSHILPAVAGSKTKHIR